MPSRHGGFRHTFHRSSHRSHHHSHAHHFGGSSHRSTGFGSRSHHTSSFGSSNRSYTSSSSSNVVDCGCDDGEIGTEEWSSNVCQWYQDCWGCVEASVCPYCVIGYHESAIEDGEGKKFDCVNTMCMMSCLFEMDFCLGKPIFITLMRRKLVAHYNINETCGETCCCMIFCMFCAIAQGSREMAARGQKHPYVMSCKQGQIDIPPKVMNNHAVGASPNDNDVALTATTNHQINADDEQGDAAAGRVRFMLGSAGDGDNNNNNYLNHITTGAIVVTDSNTGQQLPPPPPPPPGVSTNMNFAYGYTAPPTASYYVPSSLNQHQATTNNNNAGFVTFEQVHPPQTMQMGENLTTTTTNLTPTNTNNNVMPL